MLVQIDTGPHASRPFCAGLIVSNGRVVQAAPILQRETMGRSYDEVWTYFIRKGCKITEIAE